jgi:hypothetical protein
LKRLWVILFNISSLACVSICTALPLHLHVCCGLLCLVVVVVVVVVVVGWGDRMLHIADSQCQC